MTSTIPELRIGIDGRKFPRAAELGPIALLERCAALGHAGVFFRTVLDVSPTLDAGFLAAVKQRADELGLYLEMGLGKINPYNTPEAPEVRDIGQGDYVLGMTRMIEATTAIGCTALWGDTANYQRHSWGLHAIDRYRTDVDWPDQLEATRKFLLKLKPVLKDRGAVIAVETHEEITTAEIVRLIEEVGDDALGVTLDLANVVVRGEDPVAATRRLAPFVRKTHMRDIVLFARPHGLERQTRACGDGVIDWVKVLGAIFEAGSRPNFTIENVWGSDKNQIPLFDPDWQARQPDAVLGEILELIRLSRVFEDGVRAGTMIAPDDYFSPNPSLDELEGFVSRSGTTLRAAADVLRAASATKE